MAGPMFRLLRADEIECRVQTVKPNGFSLLLYKDARCDMRILDETVGPFNWKKTYSRDNANCTVSIWDDEKKQWIDKEDTGTESATEAEKGKASDAFKRACFNWGLGRELYTAPFIWISGGDSKDRYSVREIGYDQERISRLVIVDKKGNVAYQFGKGTAKQKPIQEQQAPAEDRVAKIRALTETLKQEGIDLQYVATCCKKNTLAQITDDQYKFILGNLAKLKAGWEIEKARANGAQG